MASLIESTLILFRLVNRLALPMVVLFYIKPIIETIITRRQIRNRKPTISQRPFQLFDLPPELRNHIYRCALVDSEVPLSLEDIYRRTSLLRASSQVRREAKSIFYTENHFYFTDPVAQRRDITRFLVWVGRSNSFRIPRIALRLGIPDAWRMMTRTVALGPSRGLHGPAAQKVFVDTFGTPGRATESSIFGGLVGDYRLALHTTAFTMLSMGVRPEAVIAQYDASFLQKMFVVEWLEKDTDKHFILTLSELFLQDIKMLCGIADGYSEAEASIERGIIGDRIAKWAKRYPLDWEPLN